MFPISSWRALAAVFILLATMAGIDAFLVQLDSPDAARDLASTGVLALLVVAWPWWGPRVLLGLIPASKICLEQSYTGRVAAAVESLKLPNSSITRVVVYRSEKLSAVTTGRRGDSLIAISTGLLDALGTRQLRAAIAHELGHAEGNHMILTAGYLATLLFAKSLFGALGLPITLALLLAYLALLRRNEVDADRRAADRVGNEDVVDLLLALKVTLKEPACLDWPAMSLLSTHPGYRTRAARVRDRRLSSLV